MGVNEPDVVVPRTLVASQAQGWISLFSATRLCNDISLRNTRDTMLASWLRRANVGQYSTYVESMSP